MKHTSILVLLFVVTIVVVVVYLESNGSTDDETRAEVVGWPVTTGSEAEPVPEIESATEPDLPSTGDDTDQEMAEETEAVSTEAAENTKSMAGNFTAYSEERLAAAAGGRTVLFFKANWCPSCRALEADINENLSLIPNDVTILAVDFDSATDLKVKYSVTNRHTLVQVDSAGEIIKKWSGSPGLQNILAEI